MTNQFEHIYICLLASSLSVFLSVLQYSEDVEEAEWVVQVLNSTGKLVAANMCIGLERDMHGIIPGYCAVRLVKAGENHLRLKTSLSLPLLSLIPTVYSTCLLPETNPDSQLFCSVTLFFCPDYWGQLPFLPHDLCGGCEKGGGCGQGWALCRLLRAASGVAHPRQHAGAHTQSHTDTQHTHILTD